MTAESDSPISAPAPTPAIEPSANKHDTAHLETVPAEPRKVYNGDTALALFDNFDELEGAIDPVENKRLVRKIDLMILPFLSVCYAFYYVRCCRCHMMLSLP